MEDKVCLSQSRTVALIVALLGTLALACCTRGYLRSVPFINNSTT